MNNAFGYIPEDLLQQAQEAWEFKTCQRSDGTTYGTSGDCAQRGSKEVKKSSKKSSWDDSNLAGKMGTEIAKVAGPVTNPCAAGKRRMSSGRCVKAASGTADRDLSPNALAQRYRDLGLSSTPQPPKAVKAPKPAQTAPAKNPWAANPGYNKPGQVNPYSDGTMEARVWNKLAGYGLETAEINKRFPDALRQTRAEMANTRQQRPSKPSEAEVMEAFMGFGRAFGGGGY